MGLWIYDFDTKENLGPCSEQLEKAWDERVGKPFLERMVSAAKRRIIIAPENNIPPLSRERAELAQILKR